MIEEVAFKSKIIETLSRCEDIRNPTEYFHYLTTLKGKFENDTKMRKLSQIMVALGNPDRILILDSLREKDRCVCEIEAILSKSQPNISHHLGILERATLIKGWKKGKFTHYSLIKKQFQTFNRILQEWIKTSTNWFGLTPASPD